jgi:hypothetical protein
MKGAPDFMKECRYLLDCEFVLHYVAQVKPHWDDFVTLYCRGDFQDVCKRREQFERYRKRPEPDLMPTGQRVPEILEALPEERPGRETP